MKISSTIRRNMQVNGKGTATIFAGRQHSWNQFGERIAKLASGLSKLGLDHGDRVAVLSVVAFSPVDLLTDWPKRIDDRAQAALDGAEKTWAADRPTAQGAPHDEGGGGHDGHDGHEH